MGGDSPRDGADLRYRPDLAQRRFPLAPDETHELLLAKCQIAAKDIARYLADDLPRLWHAAQNRRARAATGRGPPPRNAASTGPEMSTMCCAPSVPSAPSRPSPGSKPDCSTSGGRRLARDRMREAGHPRPQHRRHLVVAARDGFVQLTGWSPYPPGEARNSALRLG